jgi:hypothetical protein
VQAQRPDLVIVDRSVYGRFRIALVELTCPWDTDAKKTEERKTARYADLREELSNRHDSERFAKLMHMFVGGYLRTRKVTKL